MIRFKINRKVDLRGEFTLNKIEAGLHELGYSNVEITGEEIYFDHEDDKLFVRKGYFFDKADRGIVRIEVVDDAVILNLYYYISFLPALILVGIFGIGSIVVAPEIKYLALFMIVVFLYKLYVVRISFVNFLKLLRADSFSKP